MEKTILIKFSNGHWFEVPLMAVAKHRANDYAMDGGFIDGSNEWQDEIDLVMNDPFEGLDWIQNNMEWEDVVDIGEFVNTEDPYNYSEGFFDADFEVLKK
jgi:hypothetical protein